MLRTSLTYIDVEHKITQEGKNNHQSFGKKFIGVVPAVAVVVAVLCGTAKLRDRIRLVEESTPA